MNRIVMNRGSRSFLRERDIQGKLLVFHSPRNRASWPAWRTAPFVRRRRRLSVVRCRRSQVS